MSHFLDRLKYFSNPKERFSGEHGVTTGEDRTWENAYRDRWAHDKIARSTHGVNCTGSCSWKIYVKGGIVTWETQQTDYPRTRADLPNHEPRGCARGASYSWYLYSANRLKYPLVRGRLLRSWRDIRRHHDPVDAWAEIVESESKRRDYQQVRGLGGFVRASWKEVNELIAAANAYTIKKYGPDRVAGFSPIPAMSMVSYAAGSRYLSLIGGTPLSFYDWYCDLPPSSPQVWGEQTDVPESADWYNSNFIIAWGSNVPQTRTPDAHFFTEVRYKGTKIVAVTPDYSEVAKLSDLWLHPKAGTDAAVSMAMGHVILKEFYFDKRSPYFDDYARRYTDLPMLVMLREHTTPGGDTVMVPDRYVRAADFADHLGADNNPEWKTVALAAGGKVVLPNGAIGFRWGADGRADQGQWNLEAKDARDGKDTKLMLSLLEDEAHGAETARVGFPYFGGVKNPHFTDNPQDEVSLRTVPVRTLPLTVDGEQRDVMVATVFDLQAAQYGVARGLEGENAAAGYDDDAPYTPAWQERITGVPRDKVIAVARQFADNADKTKGRSMVIIGAGMNHWYHCDMNYRGIINMLMMCGCIGKSGGGWSHYVGQEKLRPQTGWTALAFALDWIRPPRQMNATSYFYAHSDQWRYEKLGLDEVLSPLADKDAYGGSMIDYNVRAERMGWLPSSPQLQRNPIQIVKDAEKAGMDPVEYTVKSLTEGSIKMSCTDPDHPDNWPRNLLVWRSNLLGSSGKGHEYFLKHLLGAENAVFNAESPLRPDEVRWRDPAPEGKLDLLVTLDIRMSTSAMYADIALPSAGWYEMHDLSTTDMHPFIHPFNPAVDPPWETRTSWDQFAAIAEKFSELAAVHLGEMKDLVATPLLHDSPGEIAQPDVLDWRKGETEAVPGRTMPQLSVVHRDFPNVYKMMTALGPLVHKTGLGAKGVVWSGAEEYEELAAALGTVAAPGKSRGMPSLATSRQAAEAILRLAPETNGETAVKSWAGLERRTGLALSHLSEARRGETFSFSDITAQPRKIITSPVWSGIESDTRRYSPFVINIEEKVPFRTLTGRAQFYQDHPWMRDFGEGLPLYRPPINLPPENGDYRVSASLGRMAPGTAPDMEKDRRRMLALNYLTPHSKWSIHSTYSDTLTMLTLFRGGEAIWISDEDARTLEVKDNEWLECFNENGVVMAKAVVSHRIPPGKAFMYHAQERLINTPGSPLSGQRGGTHNSVTRIMVKPTHMIGGYAQLSYGFNYYGPVGSQRDEVIVVRKAGEVDWYED